MSSNITMLLPAVAAQDASLSSLVCLATSLLWSAVELVLSVGVIAGYSFMLCYATSLVLRNEQSLEHSNDPDLPNKEQTCALMLTGFLGGIHVMLVFYGIPLLHQSEDSFPMRLMFSCAILAAVTTGLIVGGIILYLTVPALWSCGASLVRRVKGSSKKPDVEQRVGGNEECESKQPFLEKAAELE